MSDKKKFHIGKNGPAPCNATKRACRYGGDAHYDSMEEAETVYQKKKEAEGHSDVMTKKPANTTTDTGPTALDVTTRRVGQRMTPEVAALREAIKDRTKNKVAERAANNDIALEDANPERAERRLKEAIEYASSRKNVHLMEKLSKADVLPSGSFKRADGSRFNTDQILDNRTAIKHFESERSKLKAAMEELAKSPNLKPGQKFDIKSFKGTYSATITEGNFNEAEFTKLPKNVQDQLMKSESTLDPELIRQHISPERRAEFMNRTQVFEYVEGKPHDVGQVGVTANTTFVGGNDEQKMHDAVRKLSFLHSDARGSYGGRTIKQIEAENKEMTTDVKKAVAATRNETGNPRTFVPARSQYNGALVTERENVSSTKAKQVLTQEEIVAVSTVRYVPDRDKAAKLLPPAVFDKIFNNRGVRLYVSEK